MLLIEQVDPDGFDAALQEAKDALIERKSEEFDKFFNNLLSHLKEIGLLSSFGLPFDIEEKLSDTTTMRKYYKDYSPETARKIIDTLPKAWKHYENYGGRWVPGLVSKIYPMNATTIGRYLSAFKEAGIVEYKGVRIP